MAPGSEFDISAARMCANIRLGPRGHQRCNIYDSQGHHDGVLIMCDFSKEAAKELGEGSYVLVHDMGGPQDTLRQKRVHDAHHVHDVQDVYDSPSSIARSPDFSSSQVWHSVSLFFNDS